jgi:plastocyanin
MFSAPNFRWARPAAVAVGAMALFAAVATAQEPVEIRMQNNLYNPAEFTVTTGTSVRFVNLDTDIHTVSQRGGGFESGLMFQRDAWSYTFDTPGTYEFFCLPHPFMVGKVTVE